MPETEEKYITVSVRLPERMREQLAEDAKRNFRDLSNHIRAILSEHLEEAAGHIDLSPEERKKAQDRLNRRHSDALKMLAERGRDDG